MDDAVEIAGKLTAGHVSLLDTIDQIQPYLRSYPEAKPKIRRFQEQLFSHYSLQTDDFFRRIAEFHAHNREAVKMIEFLVHDLKEIKVKTLLFFDQHPGDMGDVRPRHFSRDFTIFSGELMARIRVERDYLLPLL